MRALLALAAAAVMMAGCGRLEGPEPPRLLTSAELAAFTAEAEAPPPENAVAARAEALRARAAGLRADRNADRRAEGDALRRRAARLSPAGD